MSIRVALADDQAMVRAGLKALLEHLGMHVAIEADNGAALLEQLTNSTIDVIVSDIRMPVLDGIAMLRALRQKSDATPVVLLTTFDDNGLLLDAVDAGVQGFLLKGASSEDLFRAIEHAHRGENWLAPVATSTLRDKIRYPVSHQPDANFGDRELAILRLLTGGYSNKEIGRSLHLAEGTVKNYVSDILAKLGTRDRTRAVLTAITLHIV